MTSETQTDWLTRTDARVGRLHADLTAVEVDEIRDLVERAVAAIDSPPDRFCGAVLSLMLMEICSWLVQRFHEGHDTSRCNCLRAAWSRTGLVTSSPTDPRPGFNEWTHTFLACFEREHPQTAATRAAALIRSDPTKVWTLTELARVIEAPPGRLRQDFQARFGVRPSMYRHLVRTAKAVALLGTPLKVEAIAWEVGYRSKKDLYAALRRWAGATPTELRALSPEEREWLERQLRVRYAGRTSGAPESADTSASRQQQPRHQPAPPLRT